MEDFNLQDDGRFNHGKHFLTLLGTLRSTLGFLESLSFDSDVQSSIKRQQQNRRAHFEAR